MKLLFTALALTAGTGAATGDGLPTSTPSAVGMSAARLAAIDRVVIRGMSAGGYPGAAVVVGRKGYAVWEKGFGRLDWTRDARVSPSETIYDLASLTKVVGTTTAVMILYDEGRIILDAPVQSYLPEFTGGYRDSVTVRQLLAHRGGLPASRDLWRVARSPEEARRMVLETELEYRPGMGFIYSDIGAILLGMIVEKVAGVGLDEFLDRRVFTPLGMTNTGFRPSAERRDHVAPTDVISPRGYPIRGEVHDENAYVMGGVAGHAGLFSTATDLSIFAQMMLNGGEYNGTRIVSDSTIELFTQRAAGSRALGWAMADGQWGSGRYLGDNSYGHVGFTGTSLWIDPDREMFVILLTNRVHAARARRPAKVISDVRADLADAASAAVMDDPRGVIAMPARFRADRADGWNPVKRRYVKRGSSKYRSSKAAKSRASKSRAGKASAARKSPFAKNSVSGSRNATVKKATVRKTGAAKAAAKRSPAKKPAAKKPSARVARR